ncbi:unnamed protein product [Gordionus sp. m RMFG-2023]
MGSLNLVKIQPGDDLSFLSTIRIIEGYLSIHSVGAPVIPLTNLKVIRGNDLYYPYEDKRKGFALFIEGNVYNGRESDIFHDFSEVERDPYLTNNTREMEIIRRVGGAIPILKPSPKVAQSITTPSVPASPNFLRYIQFYSLTEIARGGVFIGNNPGLCHLTTTVNWSDIVTGNLEISPLHIFKDQFPEQALISGPPCSSTCSLKCRSSKCWDWNNCQTVFGLECHKDCPLIGRISPRCMGPYLKDCCHLECAGGCSGPTDRDCFMCRHHAEDGGRCLPRCSFAGSRLPAEDTFDRGVNRTSARTYAMGFACVEQCPPHYLVDQGYFCVAFCSPGFIETEGTSVDLPGTCIREPLECSDTSINPHLRSLKCPKVCQTVTDVLSNNLAKLAGCEIIQGDLNLLGVTFTARRHRHNNTHSYLIRRVTRAELDALRSIRVITGFLRLQLLPDEAGHDLNFFDNLEVVAGRFKLSFDKYSISVFKTELISLGLRSLRSVPAGGVRFMENEHLCYLDVGDYSLNATSPKNVWTYLTNAHSGLLNSTPNEPRFITQDGRPNSLEFIDNKPPSDCVRENHICDIECSFQLEVGNYPKGTPKGCWGPGPHNCVKCTHSVLSIPFRAELVHQSMSPGLELPLDALYALAHLSNFFRHVRSILNESSPDAHKNTVLLNLETALEQPTFYGLFVDVCVPHCGDLSVNNRGYYDANHIERNRVTEQWLNVYRSLLTVIEQIKPTGSPSLSGEEFTFADMKLHIQDHIEEVLGRNLGLIQDDGTFPDELKIYTYATLKNYNSAMDTKASRKLMDPANGHVCRLCHSQCSGGCSGQGPHSCFSCKYFNWRGECVQVCPVGSYLGPSNVCLPCHETCIKCNGSLPQMRENGCHVCALAYTLPNNNTICIKDLCPDGFYDKVILDSVEKYDRQPRVCTPCEDVCATCRGPGPYACNLCDYYTNPHDALCTKRCPFNVYGVSGLPNVTDKERHIVETVQQATGYEARRQLERLSRCACHEECGTQVCTGPSPKQCQTCSHFSVRIFRKNDTNTSLSDEGIGASYDDYFSLQSMAQYECVSDCPPWMNDIETLGDRFICRLSSAEARSSTVLLNSSAAVLFTILILTLITCFIWRRYKKRITTDSLMNKESFLNEDALMLDKVAATYGMDEIDSVDDYLSRKDKIQSPTQDPTREVCICPILRKHVKSMKFVSRDLLADCYKATWYYPSLVKSHHKVGVKVFRKTVPLHLKTELMTLKSLLRGHFNGNLNQINGTDRNDTLARVPSGYLRIIEKMEQNVANNSQSASLVHVYGILVKKGKHDRSTKSIRNLDLAEKLLDPLIPITFVCQGNGPALGPFLRRFGLCSGPRSTDPSHMRKLAARDVLADPMPKWFSQLASGMEYLARKGIIHGCLRAECIYMYNVDHIKIDDYYYNLLVDFKSSQLRHQYIQEYYRWLPMESLAGCDLSHESDVWAFGVTIWEILSFGQVPYLGMENVEAYNEEIAGGYRLPQPIFCGVNLYQLMIRCWLQYKEIRPTFKEINKTLIEYAKHPDKHYRVDQVFLPGIFEAFANPQHVANYRLDQRGPLNSVSGSLLTSLEGNATSPPSHYHYLDGERIVDGHDYYDPYSAQTDPQYYRSMSGDYAEAIDQDVATATNPGYQYSSQNPNVDKPRDRHYTLYIPPNLSESFV